MNLKDKMIIEEYRKNRKGFNELGEYVHNKLSEAADEMNIIPLAIEHRVKQEESLVGKLYRKGERYQSLEDITDILGVRIICFFNDEVDMVGKRIEELFKIDWENSGDKRQLLEDNSFGYLSVHYICYVPQSFSRELCNYRFEIQVRTALQHVWAAIDHDISYKSRYGVPKAIVRDFSRLAGLLEVADDEFVRVRESMNTYTTNTHNKIIENDVEQLNIDMISLSEYMSCNKNMGEFLDKLAAIEGSEIANISPEVYIAQLKFLGITRLGELAKMLEKNEELALMLAERSLKGTELDILASNAALRFLCRAELLQRGASEDEITKFLKLSLFDEGRSRRQAKRLIKIYEELQTSLNSTD